MHAQACEDGARGDRARGQPDDLFLTVCGLDHHDGTSRRVMNEGARFVTAQDVDP
jgi:hypothetical protein